MRLLAPLAIAFLLAGLSPAGHASAQPSEGDPAPEAPETTEETAEDAGDEAGDPSDAGDETEPDAPPPANPYQPEDDPDRGIHIPRTICHGRIIRRVMVEGAQRVSAEDILATMRLRREVPCTDMEVTRDAQALWDLGFFDDIVFEAEVVDEQVQIIVTVTERPAIRQVTFDGNDEVDEEDIEEKITLESGSILSVPDVRRQVTKIRDLYAEEGFFLARVDYELREAPGDNNEVDVVFTIEEGEAVTVRRISFIGNDNVPDDDLTAIMQTSETGFFSFIASNDTFNQEAFDEDMVRLQAWYYDQGYLAMQVGSPRIELSADRQFIAITIPVSEGPRYRIGRVQVTETNADGEEIEPLGGREAIMGAVAAEPGEWFSRSSIAQSLQSITRTYRDAGFARVEIMPETDMDAEARIVDLNIAIRRGPPVFIERINISGNTKTRDRVVRREIEILEGDLYSMTHIESSRGRITALGYFEEVNISEEAGSGPDQMVLNFEVTEKPTGTFQVGAGFSSIEQFILTAQIQQQNLFGNGQTLSLNLQLSGIRQLIQLRFVEPWFMGSEWSLALDAFRTTRQFNIFNQDSTGGGFTFGHPVFTPRLRAFLGYRLESVNITGRLGGLFGSASGGQGFTQYDRVPLDNLFQDGLTSSVRLSLTWDSRDNRLFPSRGWYSSYAIEVASRYLGSQNDFVRQTMFARFYQRLFGPFVLKINGEVGLIQSTDRSSSPQGVPIYQRFYLGGIFNVRGYPLNSIGPRAGLPNSIDPNAFVSPTGIAIGGNLQAFYQVELEFPIVESVGIRGVLFTDGGNAWNLENQLCSLPDISFDNPASSVCDAGFNIRTSFGFGFRWFSPLGPLRFEWGIPSPRQRLSYEEKIRFEFTIGNSF